MRTPQIDPVQRNEAQQTPNDPRPNDRAPDEAIDESMVEADRANGEGDPDDASQIHRNGERNGEPDRAKPTRRAE